MHVAIAASLENFDPDELLLLIGSGVICGFAFCYWLFRLNSVSPLGATRFLRAPLYLAVLIGFLLLALVVWRWADQQIRDNSLYVLLVFLMGGACLVIVLALLRWLGLDLREDVFERRNFAAILALSGAALAALITYSAATIGRGPSFWNNVFSTILAAGTLLVLWLIVCGAQAASAVTEERDVASGVRVGSWFVAEGLILGRAVAGDWVSAAATTQDFVHDAWPALALCFIAFICERQTRPRPGNARPSWFSHGLVPAVIYFSAAVAWCAHLGWWGEGSR